MSKKNLSLLIGGFIGEARHSDNMQEQSQPDDKSVRDADTSHEPQSLETEEKMKSRLDAKRKENVGRPKKGETAKKAKEIRATFIVDPDLLRKVKYISLVDGLLLKDVISEALTTYIDGWEERNKKIRLPKKK